MKRATILLLLLSCGALSTGCQERTLEASVSRLRSACSSIDPTCGKGANEQDVVEETAGLLGQIKGLCEGLDTGSVTCRDKLQDLAGVMGQVGSLAGGWVSM